MGYPFTCGTWCRQTECKLQAPQNFGSEDHAIARNGSLQLCDSAQRWESSWSISKSQIQSTSFSRTVVLLVRKALGSLNYAITKSILTIYSAETNLVDELKEIFPKKHVDKAVSKILAKFDETDAKALLRAGQLTNKRAREAAIAAAQEQIAKNETRDINDPRVQKALRQWKEREDKKAEDLAYKNEKEIKRAEQIEVKEKVVGERSIQKSTDSPVGTVVESKPKYSKVGNPQPPEPALSSNTITLQGKAYRTDSWTNVPSNITQLLGRKLHLQPSHPISLTRSLIESCFPASIYKHHNDLNPIVTGHQNFDSLGFPTNHPGRSKTDTYYINKDTVLRTHTSAHQADTFRQNASEGFLISADVYRRDAVDRSHYPVFHQMEGAQMWDRRKVPGGDIAKAVWEDIERLPKHDMAVEDPNPTIHADRNPLQGAHTTEEVEAIATHLKRSIELMVVEIFRKANEAAIASGEISAEKAEEPLRVRWIEAYFPFTSPSWEMEVFWQGDWLEILGSGVVKQELLNNAGLLPVWVTSQLITC
jgi:phenylalanyl-tRNA synthetase alpha subunit